ncbi:MAG: acyl-CoA carboxylase subunit beta [Phycisphaerae bacterium]|nr:acyl-CoA carboxylase subunit beta [Phycisphaerae bacterium]MCZ2399815.1 acyl-CoA carboxylase subunit beta [Phycisphaerae bacterium]NUQ49243.1 acyl-CoA carboxylase subunit beta [Phycisphaerae bacterium]
MHQRAHSHSTPLLDAVLEEIRAREEVIRQGGGKAGVERQHKLGRLTARERVELLCDRNVENPFLELGLWAAEGMYAEAGGVPAAGVVVGLARVMGRLCVVVANDATVKAGAFFPATCKKVLRAQRFCMDNHLPIIYLVDSAGVYLPMQDEIFPDEDDFGRIFRHNAVISAMGIPQIAAIMGNCVAGGGYLPVMCDTLLMTEGSGLYLAGPALVKAAIGQEQTSEEIGGAKMHASISGTIDYREVNDELCIARVRRLVGKLGAPPHTPFNRVAPHPPRRHAETIYDVVAGARRGEYDVRELLEHVLDRDSFDEYKAEYGQSLVCGFARLDGWSVGVVANQKKQVKPAKGPLQFGSVIYVDSADKAARFIMDCNQMKCPIIFIQDVNGFMVGRDSEQEGIIRSGAKLVSAVSNSVVPKITLITGGSFGAGNYAMCGKAYDPRFIFAWPLARYAVMGGAAAAKTLLQLEVATLKKKGHEPDEAELLDLERRITRHYEETMDVRYAASRGWVDAIIAPADTRRVLATALEACAYVGDLPELRVGVFQV